MKENSFWLFRSNLTILESYHKQYNNINEFKKECWDFYLLMSLWFLENNYFNKVYIWRLLKNPKEDIVFKIGNKELIQKFVTDLNECFKYPSPKISFFRGGFTIYDKITSLRPNFLGLKLYLGASSRVLPLSGKYDKILVESNTDLKFPNSIPFYKSTNPEIFKNLNKEKKYDICYPCNFSQYKYKGQDWFFKEIANSEFLKELKIIQVGNNEKVGKKMCSKLNLKNIEFTGQVDRFKLNEILNESKFGLVTSNNRDGCPRVVTEILSSKTPLILRNETRVLDFYKKLPYVFNFKNVKELEGIVRCYEKAKKKILLDNDINFDNICNSDISLWR